MKESILTKMRDKRTSMADFKRASDQLSEIIASEIASNISEKPISFHTPLKETTGKKIAEDIVLIPILRSGLALLPSFMRFFENARIAFIGIQRDKLAHPTLDYEKIPPLTGCEHIIILDPMIATSGSMVTALEKLIDAGGSPNQMTVVGFVAAPDGLNTIKKKFPTIKIKIAAIDEGLNEYKYIVPGLGDFGNRYFGC